MALTEETIEALVSRYMANNMVLAFGSGRESETFVKKLAKRIEEEELKVSVVPTSARMAEILSSLHIKTVSINEREIDVAIEFADAVDSAFNYIKRDSSSFVRDKMVAQSAAELMVITGEENYGKRLVGIIPFEVCQFGWKRTLIQLENLGSAKLRMHGGNPVKTETNHHIIDVKIDKIYSLEDLEFQAKDIPGVLETGLFIGYADRILLHNGELKVKSRLTFEKQHSIETMPL